MTEDLIISSLEGLRESVEATNAKIDSWLSRECPEKHKTIEHRLTSLELRVYGIVLFGMFLMTVFGDKVKALLHL